jgi:hypothetical protein
MTFASEGLLSKSELARWKRTALVTGYAPRGLTPGHAGTRSFGCPAAGLSEPGIKRPQRNARAMCTVSPSRGSSSMACSHGLHHGRFTAPSPIWDGDMVSTPHSTAYGLVVFDATRAESAWTVSCSGSGAVRLPARPGWPTIWWSIECERHEPGLRQLRPIGRSFSWRVRVRWSADRCGEARWPTKYVCISSDQMDLGNGSQVS